jgi:peroxiredoxin Q/BCP
MRRIGIGRKVPDITLPATGGETVSLEDLRGSNVVVYFYPKDNTPGCSLEGQDFRNQYAKFQRLKTVVLGISRDTVKSHENFRSKYALPFPLLSDAEEEACRAFDVIRDKNMYGRQVRGIERSTFLIDADGVLRREWRKVKVKGHVGEVLDAVKQISNNRAVEPS